MIKRPEQTNINYCSHYVLGECSQNHHNNCVGMASCIRDIEQENKRLRDNIALMTKYNGENFEETLKFRKALEEIREDCQNNYDMADENADIWDTAIGDFSKELLTKINEVLK